MLKVKFAGAKGLRPTAVRNSETQNSNGSGSFSCRNEPLSTLGYFLEETLEIPVLDRTGLEGRFDINLQWSGPDWEHRNPDALKHVLMDELGLELVPAREPVEMLIVDSAK